MEQPIKLWVFQAEREGNTNSEMDSRIKWLIFETCVAKGVTDGKNLGFIPEVYMVLAEMAGSMRDDLYRILNILKQPLDNNTIQNVFICAFNKGFESAFLWHLYPTKGWELIYDPQSIIEGVVEFMEEVEEVIHEHNEMIQAKTKAMILVYEELKNQIIMDPYIQNLEGGRYLTDVIASSFLWSSVIGLDVGMKLLGYNLHDTKMNDSGSHPSRFS